MTKEYKGWAVFEPDGMDELVGLGLTREEAILHFLFMKEGESVKDGSLQEISVYWNTRYWTKGYTCEPVTINREVEGE